MIKVIRDISQKRKNKQAYEAIHNGIEQNFVWNVEQAGNNRTYRILQKRGKIIDAEDFQSVKDTYPQYPKQNRLTLDPSGSGTFRNTKNCNFSLI